MSEPRTQPTHDDILRRIARVEERFATALEDVASELKRHADEEQEIRRFLFGSVEGPGLVELVRAHERWIGTQRRIFMVMVPAVILGVAAVVWQAVVFSLQRAAG